MMNSKRNALGRGLSAILRNPKTDITDNGTDDKNLVASTSEIAIEDIQINPFQPRVNFEKEKIYELAESIKELGIIQPITVRKLGYNKFQLISGERRLKAAKEKTNLNDAIRTAVGKSMGNDIVIACMDFSFIGGSMGSVVGEKIARAIDYSLKKKIPLVIISKSGGARMMEAAISLMQLAKTSAKLAQLADAKVPYISLCTDPTTGGTTASFAMLGDVNISEPGALIGFAGPRVVKDTTGKTYQKDFKQQNSY